MSYLSKCLGTFRHNVDRFDLIVLSVLLFLGMTTGLILLRGDQIGVEITELVPAPDSTAISTRTEIRLTFDEAMDEPSAERRLRVAPPMKGTFRWRGRTLIWQSQSPLASDTRHVVTLEAGARSAQGRTLKDDLTWTFHTGQPRVLFIRINEISRMHVVGTADLDTHQLTHLEDGSSVWDYAVSPDGGQVALGVVRPDASAVDLWLMNADGSDARLWLACDNSQCTGASWSPDGRRLAYEKRELNVDLGAMGAGLGPGLCHFS